MVKRNGKVCRSIPVKQVAIAPTFTGRSTKPVGPVPTIAQPTSHRPFRVDPFFIIPRDERLMPREVRFIR